MGVHRPLEERFWERVDKKGPNECWLWTAATAKGYGHISENYKRLSAPRVSLRLSGVHIPKGKCALHICDVPLCVNPAHLYVGTQADNMRDMYERKRGRNCRKTHCKYGHPFFGDNLKIYPKRPKHRVCRKCEKNKNELYSGKRKLMRLAQAEPCPA